MATDATGGRKKRKNYKPLVGRRYEFALLVASGKLSSLRACALAVLPIGYDEDNANRKAMQWLKDPQVQAKIALERSKHADAAGVDAAWVRRHLKIAVERWVESGERLDGPEAKALELLGRDVGLWPDKLTIEHVQKLPLELYLPKLREALALMDAQPAQLPAPVDVTPKPEDGA